MSHNTLHFNPTTRTAEIRRNVPNGSTFVVRNVTSSSVMRIERVTYRYFTRLLWREVLIGPETCKEWGQ